MTGTAKSERTTEAATTMPIQSPHFEVPALRRSPNSPARQTGPAAVRVSFLSFPARSVRRPWSRRAAGARRTNDSPRRRRKWYPGRTPSCGLFTSSWHATTQRIHRRRRTVGWRQSPTGVVAGRRPALPSVEATATAGNSTSCLRPAAPLQIPSTAAARFPSSARHAASDRRRSQPEKNNRRRPARDSALFS